MEPRVGKKRKYHEVDRKYWGDPLELGRQLGINMYAEACENLLENDDEFEAVEGQRFRNDLARIEQNKSLSVKATLSAHGQQIEIEFGEVSDDQIDDRISAIEELLAASEHHGS